jgi:pilus assembly protein FimV
MALGFGPIAESIGHGQALDLSVPLRLDSGDNLSLSPAGLNAELSLGAQRLPKSAVRLQLDSKGQGADAARVRIRSNVAVYEPAVAVKLSVGVSGLVSRQFMVFADPSVTALEAAPLLVAETPRPAAGVPPGVRTQAAQTQAPKSVSAAQPAARGDPHAAPRLKLEAPEALLQAATLAVAARDMAQASAAQAANAAQAAAAAAEQRMAALQ